MFSQFEEKGKIFTNVVNKKPINVRIQTHEHIILGTVHIRPDNRLKDEINLAETFLAVTDAVVQDLSGNVVFRSNFIAVNRTHIIWLLPTDEAMTS